VHDVETFKEDSRIGRRLWEFLADVEKMGDWSSLGQSGWIAIRSRVDGFLHFGCIDKG